MSYFNRLLFNCLLLSVFLSFYSCAVSDEEIMIGQGGAQVAGNEDRFGSLIAGMNNNSMGGMSGGNFLPETCNVGDNLGLCAICGPDQRPKMPFNDPNCPAVNCEFLSTYAVREVEDGGKVCERFASVGMGGQCQALGECLLEPEVVCVTQAPVELFTAYPGCLSFVGCEGTEAPTANMLPVGEICHSFGSCQADGRCDVPVECDGLDAAGSNQYCAVNNGSCEVYASINSYQNLQSITCIAYCQRGGRECFNGWESSGGCNKGRQLGCAEAQRDVICQCASE